MTFSESNLKCNLKSWEFVRVYDKAYIYFVTLTEFCSDDKQVAQYSLFAQNNFYAVSRNIEIRRSRRASQSPVKTWANFKRAVLFTLHFGLFVFAKAETEITGFMQLHSSFTLDFCWLIHGCGNITVMG